MRDSRLDRTGGSLTVLCMSGIKPQARPRIEDLPVDADSGVEIAYGVLAIDTRLQRVRGRLGGGRDHPIQHGE